MTEKAFLIPESLKNGLIEYLGSRPWREVAGAMQQLMVLKESATEPDDCKEVNEK